ncbi:MAG: GlsB/YeaQ/YmgE family stress response membrane protein [Acidimicrobiales bacterium]|nr:GlsB/YeaQ/YmgE family stress response membrane protein [Acidimicrobiales bacterium]
MWALFTFLVVGFIAGLIARMFVSESGVKGCMPTTLLGVVGSFVGGFLGYVIFDKDLADGGLQTAGLFGSIVGAIIALLAYRKFATGRA